MVLGIACPIYGQLDLILYLCGRLGPKMNNSGFKKVKHKSDKQLGLTE
ncbi:MAG: hypothetical protein CM1200mP22_24620 [Dehalococcoidia bacterium]|nr:MAG: hypothetical protein CM1200mP22_24620 [Dehalococcoidia bacterium]